MAVNWFEGGRRISWLCMGLVVVGAVLLVWTDAKSRTFVTFTTAGPDEPWRYSTTSCKEPDLEQLQFDHAFGSGERRTISLCFLSTSNGQIPYQVAPADIITPPPLVRTNGGPPPSPPTLYYTGDPNTIGGPVSTYVSQRNESFALTPQLEADAKRGMNTAGWKARWETLRYAAPFLLGTLVFIWMFTVVVGWIVRGFTGVPAGEDFKKQQRQATDA